MTFGQLFLVCGAVTFLGSGCAPRLGASDYSIGGVGEFSHTHYGVITGKRLVRISAKETGKDNQPGLGALMGAGVGALAGSQIGYGKGQVAGAVAGGLLGGVGAHYLEDALTAQEGWELTVRLEDGKVVTVVQGTDVELAVGQRVKVVQSKTRSRVLPA